MQHIKLAATGILAASLVACGGGDININADDNSSLTDNSVTNSNNTSTGGSGNQITCASYVDGGGNTQTGVVDGDNCVYSEAFVDFNNPLTSSITLSDIGDGAHIFAGSLFVGVDYATLAAAEAAGIERGGDGPILTIRPGVTVALQNSEDFIAVMRGSRIEAQGTSDAPITFTSEDDLRGLVTPEQVQTWGGMIINGFGFTNSCAYEAGFDIDNPSAGTLTLEAGQDCSILQEGAEGARENHYGGTVIDDNSGTLRYVVVKHAGFEVLEGNELNGITFGAVGSGTTIENLEIYANKDDGVEFFGGSVNMTNYVAMYVQDDSIDIDQGYHGTITNALVIQGDGSLDNPFASGQHCVESDGSGSGRKAINIANGYTSKATITNLTCILSAKGPGFSGQGDPSAGINVEEAHRLQLSNSIVTTAYASDATVDSTGTPIPAANIDFTNYCFQLEDSEDFIQAGNGLLSFTNNLFACHDGSANKDRDADFTLTGAGAFTGNTGKEFLENQGNLVVFATEGLSANGTTPPDGDGSMAGGLTILDGFYSLAIADMSANGDTDLSDDLTGTYIGAVQASDDWTAGWTYGLHDGNRGQALWFE